MKSCRDAATTACLTLLAFGGLVAGHSLSYLLVAPETHARQELLRATGHGSHDLFLTWGLAAAIAAVIGLFAAHLKNGWGSEWRRRTISATARRLWFMQTLGFVLLEVTERGYGLHHVGDVLHEPAFLLGLVAQALVALGAAFLVFVLRRTVDVIRRLLSPLPAAGTAASKTFPSDFTFSSSAARLAWNLRGPPITAHHQG